MGMLDLYLQPHDVVDTTVSDYLSTGRLVAYTGNVVPTSDIVYMLTEDIMYIGYLDSNIFIIALLIHRLSDDFNQDVEFMGKPGGTGDLTTSLRFNNPPNVRKLTDKTMKELKEVFTEGGYINIENALKRHVG